MLSRFKTLLHCDHLPDNECFSMKKSIILKEKDGKERGMKRKEKWREREGEEKSERREK